MTARSRTLGFPSVALVMSELGIWPEPLEDQSRSGDPGESMPGGPVRPVWVARWARAGGVVGFLVAVGLVSTDPGITILRGFTQLVLGLGLGAVAGIGAGGLVRALFRR